jgi:hypothetical protein
VSPEPSTSGGWSTNVFGGIGNAHAGLPVVRLTAVRARLVAAITFPLGPSAGAGFAPALLPRTGVAQICWPLAVFTA